jgi:hypothetical protein
MPAVDRNRPKICHCKPDCNRLLGFDQRKNHYQLVNDPLTIRRSTTPPAEELSDGDELISEAMEGIDIEQHEHQDNEDTGMSEILYGVDNACNADGEDFDTGQEAGDGFFDRSDEEPFESDSEDDLFEPLLSLDEIREAIEDEIGPCMDLKMWSLREP